MLDKGRREFIKTRQTAYREREREREREQRRTVERLRLEDKGSMQTSDGYAPRD
jgi:hypothetical protein